MSDNTEYDIPWQLGALEARMTVLEKKIEKIEGLLQEVLDRTNVARGGLRVLIAVGTFAATVAAAIVEVTHYLRGR